MSNGLNTLLREVAPKSLFESALDLISSASSWLQGDVLILDTTTHLIRKPTTEAECATVLGIAVQTIVNGKQPSPVQGTMVDASEGNDDIKGPVYGAIFSMVAKTGDAFVAGQQVAFDPATGTRGVTSGAGTKPIGVYQGPAIASATAGQEIPVLIGCRSPNDSLKF